jgi:hypothetical protein
MNRPEGCHGEGVACRYGSVWEMAEGSSALNEILLPVASTWDTFRQSPSGYYGPTMDNQTLVRRDGKVVSRKVDQDVQNESEGPGWWGMSG